MRFFSFVLSECLALAIWSTGVHGWAIFFAVMGFVLVWILRPIKIVKKVHAGKATLEVCTQCSNDVEWLGYPPPPGVYAEFCEQIREKLEGK